MKEVGYVPISKLLVSLLAKLDETKYTAYCGNWPIKIRSKIENFAKFSILRKGESEEFCVPLCNFQRNSRIL
jgi:hypothetical protein